ncbi:hypothetical protein Tco_0371977 [Tanacetum coccineum]
MTTMYPTVLVRGSGKKENGVKSEGRQNRGQGNNARGAGAAGYRGAQNRVGNANITQLNLLSTGSIPNTMLDRTNFASWQQRIRLYCQGKENGVNILKLIDEGPFHVGTTRGHSLPTGNNKIWITLTFLATTPTSRVTKGHLHSYQSFYDAKEYAICEDALGRTKEKLFTTTMSGLPNSSMTSVKLNRGLRDSNYDQLYAYLKQHEAHVNENKMMLDQFTQHTVDPLALMSNVSHQQYYS